MKQKPSWGRRGGVKVSERVLSMKCVFIPSIEAVKAREKEAKK